MDTLVHGVIGAAICSRTGLAGGRRGPVDAHGVPRKTDWTLWAAFLFGIFPDVASLGIHFLADFFVGNGVRWHAIPPFIFTLYNITHSLTGMVIGYFLLVAWKRSLWLPALAWPLHVLMDIPTHGAGVFMTPILWPFSNAGVVGWNWWQTNFIFYGSWLFALGLWLAVAMLRISSPKIRED